MLLFGFKFPEPYDARMRAAALQRKTLAQRTLEDEAWSSASEDSNKTVGRSGALLGRAGAGLGRSQQQFSLFLAGAALVGVTTLITRRATARKINAVRPAGLFSQSNKLPEVNGAMDAAEAFALATVNVCSFGLMIGGGVLWALDISTLEDLRGKVRKGMPVEGEGRTEQESEEDVEEWMSIVMARMSGRSDQELAEMVKQAAARGNTEVKSLDK